MSVSSWFAVVCDDANQLCLSFPTEFQVTVYVSFCELARESRRLGTLKRPGKVGRLVGGEGYLFQNGQSPIVLDVLWFWSYSETPSPWTWTGTSEPSGACIKPEGSYFMLL